MAVDGNKGRSSSKGGGIQRRNRGGRQAKTAYDRLLKSALDVLLEGGCSRFRIAETAKRAGVSRGIQFYHFSKKLDLIEAAIEAEFESEVDVHRKTASETAQGNIIRAAAEQFEAFLAGKLFRACSNLVISVKEPKSLVDKVKAISTKSRDPIASAWIERLVDAGADPETARDAFWLLWNVQRGLSAQKHIGGDPGGDDDILDYAVGLTNDYVRQRSPAFDGGDRPN